MRFPSSGHEDHVRAILAGAEDQIDLAGRRIVSANDLRTLGCEPQLAVHEGQAVRSRGGPEIDRRQGLPLDQIDDCYGVERSAAVVRNVGRAAVSRGDHFVGIRT